MIGEPCNNNKECGSKKSSSKDYCETIYGPSDADGMIEFMLLYFILLSTIVIGFFAFIITICHWISLLIKRII